jgi:hypothetical protein
MALFHPTFDMFYSCSCTYFNTLLIDTNGTNFTRSQLHTKRLDILHLKIHANGNEPLT